jgi:uncharacterized membrane protein YhaH (DUF805 family)
MASIHTANGQRSVIPDYAAQRRRSAFWIVALVLIVIVAGLYLTSGPSDHTAADTNAGPSTPQNTVGAQTAPSAR